jgi:polyketide cyclase/dehydrase/lipid transport protein
MARYVTRIQSKLTAAQAFDYMADFAHARDWDPSVSEARQVDDAPVALGTGFDVVARFAGRDVPLRYTIVEYDAPRLVVLEARRPGFVSRDSISVEPVEGGSVVHYDATLAFSGIGRLFDPVMQLIFNRVGANATRGMQAALSS